MRLICETEFQHWQGWMKMMSNEENVAEATENVYLPPKRLHPADTIFSFIKIIKDSILAMGIGALSLIRQTPTVALSIIAGVFVLMIVVSFVAWLRYTYRVEDGELRIEKGIFVRKKSYVSIHRIHKIDFTANVLHRIFKLVEMNVDTAGGGNTVSLTALKRSDAEILRQALKRDHVEEETSEVDEDLVAENPKKAISLKHLVIAGATSGSAGFLILGVVFLFSQLGQFIPETAYEQALEIVIQLSLILIIIAIVFGLIGLWLLGTLGTVIKFGNFTIEKRPEELFIKRGLLETKELTIPYDRIQAIKVEQTILRKPVKFSRIVAITASGGDMSTEANPVIFPMIPTNKVEQFLEEFVPEYANMDQELIPLAKKGLKYYIVKHILFFLLALIPVVYFVPRYSWIPVVLIGVSALFGWMKFKESGYVIDGRRIIFKRWLFFSNYRTIAFRKRGQSYQIRQHKLQQIEHLATTNMDLISLGVEVSLQHVTEEDANLIADWFSRR